MSLEMIQPGNINQNGQTIELYPQGMIVTLSFATTISTGSAYKIWRFGLLIFDESFSGASAISITPELIQEHISKRLSGGSATETVNQEHLGALRRMFPVAIKQRLLT